MTDHGQRDVMREFGGLARPGQARRSLRSALLGQADDVALRVGDQRKSHAGHVLGLLNDPAASSLPGSLRCRRHQRRRRR
jgi:hypothetical protein